MNNIIQEIKEDLYNTCNSITYNKIKSSIVKPSIIWGEVNTRLGYKLEIVIGIKIIDPIVFDYKQN